MLIIFLQIQKRKQDMSYSMVHLKIAYGLLSRDGGMQIKRLGDFLLGSVAPDAVHFHKQYGAPKSR